MSDHIVLAAPARHGGLCFDQPGWSIAFEEEDIHRSSDWRIHQPRHTMIVHLGGQMDVLETELDGHGGCSGPAQPGEVWTVPAGRRYAASGKGGLIHYAVICMDPQSSGALHQSGETGADFVSLAGHRDKPLQALVSRLGRQLSGFRGDTANCFQESAHRILNHLCRHYGNGAASPVPGPQPAPGLAAPTVRRLRRWIQDRLAERLLLEDLAMEAGVSVHQLLIGFRHWFGTTPAQYILRQRLRTAEHLLTTTRKDITTIALETGFSSHSHLTRVFHQKTGCPPSRFRMGRIDPL